MIAKAILIGSCSCMLATTFNLHAVPKTEARRILENYDKNKDGVLDEAELTAYFADKNREQFDKNKDGIVTDKEVLDSVNPTNKSKKFLEQNPAGQANELDIQQGLKLDPTVMPDFLDSVRSYIQLRKSFLTPDDNADDPAKLSWNVARHDSSYSFDGALSIARNQAVLISHVPLRSWKGTLQWVPTFEAHVSNVKADSPDSVAFGIPFRFIMTPLDLTSTRLKAVDFSLTPVFETDSRFAVKTFTVNPLVTIGLPMLAIGKGVKVGSPNIVFSWRPYVGFELGRVIDDHGDTTLQERGTITRFVAKAHADLRLGDHFKLTADGVVRQQLDGEDHTFVYGEAGPVLYLDPDQHLSLGATLKTGKRTPTFKDEHAVNVWLGLQF